MLYGVPRTRGNADRPNRGAKGQQCKVESSGLPEIPPGKQMKISEVRVFLVEEDRLKAYVTITLDECFVVRDLKVVRGNSGLFVAMPAKRRKDGTFKDIAHPLNSDTRKWMEDQILEAYEAEFEKDPTAESHTEQDED